MDGLVGNRVTPLSYYKGSVAVPRSPVYRVRGAARLRSQLASGFAGRSPSSGSGVAPPLSAGCDRLPGVHLSTGYLGPPHRQPRRTITVRRVLSLICGSPVLRVPRVASLVITSSTSEGENQKNNKADDKKKSKATESEDDDEDDEDDDESSEGDDEDEESEEKPPAKKQNK